MLGPKGEWYGFVLEWTPFGGVARPVSVCFDEHGAVLEGICWTRSVAGTYQSEGASPMQLHLGDELVGGRAGLREKLRRKSPDASAEEIEHQLDRWLLKVDEPLSLGSDELPLHCGPEITKL